MKKQKINLIWQNICNKLNSILLYDFTNCNGFEIQEQSSSSTSSEEIWEEEDSKEKEIDR